MNRLSFTYLTRRVIALENHDTMGIFVHFVYPSRRSRLPVRVWVCGGPGPVPPGTHKGCHYYATAALDEPAHAEEAASERP